MLHLSVRFETSKRCPFGGVINRCNFLWPELVPTTHHGLWRTTKYHIFIAVPAKQISLHRRGENLYISTSCSTHVFLSIDAGPAASGDDET